MGTTHSVPDLTPSVIFLLTKTASTVIYLHQTAQRAVPQTTTVLDPTPFVAMEAPSTFADATLTPTARPMRSVTRETSTGTATATNVSRTAATTWTRTVTDLMPSATSPIMKTVSTVTT